MKLYPFIVTINETDQIRVYAMDATQAASRASTVWDYTTKDQFPGNPVFSVSTKMDLRDCKAEQPAVLLLDVVN